MEFNQTKTAKNLKYYIVELNKLRAKYELKIEMLERMNNNHSNELFQKDSCLSMAVTISKKRKQDLEISHAQMRS